MRKLIRKLIQRRKQLFTAVFVFAIAATLVACEHGGGGY